MKCGVCEREKGAMVSTLPTFSLGPKPKPVVLVIPSKDGGFYQKVLLNITRCEKHQTKDAQIFVKAGAGKIAQKLRADFLQAAALSGNGFDREPDLDDARLVYLDEGVTIDDIDVSVIA